jgi:small subunit ribosomal protein S7
MPRRANFRKRETKPDHIYVNKLVAKLINRSMLDGKKITAEKQVYKAFTEIEKKTKKDPVKVFISAISNIKPNLEVRSRRVGGAAYQVPVPVKGDRKETLAIRWLVNAARARSNSEFPTYADKLKAEILDASNEEGGAFKKKIDTEKMAEANRAFAHFKW